MELTWYGQGCVRLRGKEGVVVADAFRSVVGPTGRGLTADIATYSHAEPGTAPARAAGGPTVDFVAGNAPPDLLVPTSLERSFCLAGPGEYEVHDILITGVRSARDETKGAERGANVIFVYELDGVRVAHLGDLGHLLTEDQLGEVGEVQVVCVPIGGHLTAARAAEVAAQLDAGLVVPLAVGGNEEETAAAMGRFLHEMGAKDLTPQARMSVTPSSVPEEATVVLLEARGRG